MSRMSSHRRRRIIYTLMAVTFISLVIAGYEHHARVMRSSQFGQGEGEFIIAQSNGGTSPGTGQGGTNSGGYNSGSSVSSGGGSVATPSSGSNNSSSSAGSGNSAYVNGSGTTGSTGGNSGGNIQSNSVSQR